MMIGVVILIGLNLVGAALLLLARKFSVKYNIWTLQLRSNRALSAAPNVEQVEKNIRIMTWVIRVFGLSLILISDWNVLQIFHRR
jgi:hypothetical protein